MNTALVTFDIVARLNRVSVDLRAVQREFDLTEEETSPQELLRIAKHFGFRAKLKPFSIEAITGKYPLPAIIICSNSDPI